MDHNKLWKILRDGSTRPPWLSPKKPVFKTKKLTVRTGHDSKIGEEV